MEYQDLRDWIQIADEMGELKTLKGCDWNLEIGAITEIVAHKGRWPRGTFRRYQGILPKVFGFCRIHCLRASAWR